MHTRGTHDAASHSGRIAIVTGQICRFWCAACLSLAAGAVWVSLAMAQQPVAPAPPPELNLDMLNLPVVPTDEVPGLRQFTRTSFDAGHVAWTMVGMIAAIFLLAPGLAF